MTDGTEAYEAWKRRRLAALKAPEGWLTTIGRYALETGTVSVGSAENNDIVLPVGPAHVGRLTQHENGSVSFAPADGSPETSLPLDLSKPPRFRSGDLLLEIATFNGENALRVRDTASSAPAHLTELRYFPYDPAWRVTARWYPLETPIRLTIDTAKGVRTEVESTRKAAFDHEGRHFELLATHGTREAPQFVLRDATSGKETFASARFVFGEDVTDDTVVLDFNKAVNPPCAFSDHTTCPFPPPENVFSVRIEAGELAPRPGDRRPTP